MGKRGPRPMSDEVPRLKGNPGHRRLSSPERIPTAAEVMSAITGESPLGFLERHARSGGDPVTTALSDEARAVERWTSRSRPLAMART